MANLERIQKCKAAAQEIRRDIIRMAYGAGNQGAHLGGSLSLAEILSALYVGTLSYMADDPDWEYRDRVILSKGHGALALYPALVQAGILQKEQLDTYKQNDSDLTGHPSRHREMGIEYASGSLGQGLSLGVGVGLALQRKNNTSSRVFVILGDGECDEGSVWEAAASAAHFGLKQLVAIVDENQIQYDGATSSVMNMAPAKEKWESFGWEVIAVDGHDVSALLDAYDHRGEKPLAILAKTVKGKGISFMEGDWRYHNARLSTQQYEAALSELDGAV